MTKAAILSLTIHLLQGFFVNSKKSSAHDACTSLLSAVRAIIRRGCALLRSSVGLRCYGNEGAHPCLIVAFRMAGDLKDHRQFGISRQRLLDIVGQHYF